MASMPLRCLPILLLGSLFSLSAAPYRALELHASRTLVQRDSSAEHSWEYFIRDTLVEKFLVNGYTVYENNNYVVIPGEGLKKKNANFRSYLYENRDTVYIVNSLDDVGTEPARIYQAPFDFSVPDTFQKVLLGGDTVTAITRYTRIGEFRIALGLFPACVEELTCALRPNEKQDTLKQIIYAPHVGGIYFYYPDNGGDVSRGELVTYHLPGFEPILKSRHPPTYSKAGSNNPRRGVNYTVLGRTMLQNQILHSAKQFLILHRNGWDASALLDRN